MKHVVEICVSLETSSFIDNVAKEAGFMMIDTDFENKINKNPNLLAFNNGILDLSTMTLREGLPSDRITITTGIDYDPKPEFVSEVKRFLAEILPNKSVRDYTLYYLASCLYGENDQQKLVVMTGEGGNGKSLLIKLVEQVMGEYVGTLDVAYITQKRAHSSKASPEILSLRYKRIGIIQEPDKSDVLNMGIVKQLTGNDNVVARPLFGELVKFNNTAKLIMLCNDIPAPSSNDDGVWRRLRIINFPMKFVDDPTEPNERKRDYTIEKKFQNWGTSFMSILLKYYKKYVDDYKRKIPEPQEIKNFTNNYMEGHNDYLSFCKSMLVKQEFGENGEEKENEERNIISSNELYTKLKQWYELENLGKCPPKKEFIPYLRKTFGKDFTGLHGLRGYTFYVENVENKDNNDDNDIVLIDDDDIDKSVGNVENNNDVIVI
jgi:P4 family phage/plasmid primase-like protien